MVPFSIIFLGEFYVTIYNYIDREYSIYIKQVYKQLFGILLFHPSILHFVTILIVLLTFPCGRSQ